MSAESESTESESTDSESTESEFDGLLALGTEAYVSLTTFRKTGVPVSTAVWIARDGDTLLVTTSESTGKVKRLRNDPRVELQTCSRTGKVREGAPVRMAHATIERDHETIERDSVHFLQKYKLQYRIFAWVEGIAARRKGLKRVLLRITADA